MAALFGCRSRGITQPRGTRVRRLESTRHGIGEGTICRRRSAGFTSMMIAGAEIMHRDDGADGCTSTASYGGKPDQIGVVPLAPPRARAGGRAAT